MNDSPHEILNLGRFDDMVHEVLARASRVADKRKSECISGTHIVYSALLSNQLVAYRARQLGIYHNNLLHMIDCGTRLATENIPFCPAVERGLNSSSGGLTSLLGALADEDPAMLNCLHECSSTGAPVEEVRKFLSLELGEVERPHSSVVRSRGEPSGTVLPVAGGFDDRAQGAAGSGDDDV